MLMEVGSRVIKWRESKGLSTYKLAKLSGVSQTYLREIEQGSKQPTVEIVDKICTALGITLSEFFAEEEGSQIDTRAAHLADGATELPPEAEKELEQLMEYLRHKYGKKQ